MNSIPINSTEISIYVERPTWKFQKPKLIQRGIISVIWSYLVIADHRRPWRDLHCLKEGWQQVGLQPEEQGSRRARCHDHLGIHRHRHWDGVQVRRNRLQAILRQAVNSCQREHMVLISVSLPLGIRGAGLGQACFLTYRFQLNGLRADTIGPTMSVTHSEKVV